MEIKSGSIGSHVKHWQISLAILATLSASLALADDFKTINGKEYKNATVSRVEPDGLVLKFSRGIVKVPFTELSEELRRKYNYDPGAARAFTAETQRQADLNSQTGREEGQRAAQKTPDHSNSLLLQYHSPEELAAAAHKAARAKMFSPEEENAELAKIPPGGALEVRLSSITIDTANPKWLTYVIGNAAGEVLQRKQGTDMVPSSESEISLWLGFDYVPLPAFNDSLRVRVYHEIFGSLGDYVVQRSGEVTRAH